MLVAAVLALDVPQRRKAASSVRMVNPARPLMRLLRTIAVLVFRLSEWADNKPKWPGLLRVVFAPFVLTGFLVAAAFDTDYALLGAVLVAAALFALSLYGERVAPKLRSPWCRRSHSDWTLLLLAPTSQRQPRRRRDPLTTARCHSASWSGAARRRRTGTMFRLCEQACGSRRFSS